MYKEPIILQTSQPCFVHDMPADLKNWQYIILTIEKG